MRHASIVYYRPAVCEMNMARYFFRDEALGLMSKTESDLLRSFLLWHLHGLLSEVYRDVIQFDLNNDLLMENYVMDRKIIQLLIRDIIETGEYTLEGIAYYTRIPIDVIVDAACGSNCNLSITPWLRVVDLYMQVKPEISKRLFSKLFNKEDDNFDKS